MELLLKDPQSEIKSELLKIELLSLLELQLLAFLSMQLPLED